MKQQTKDKVEWYVEEYIRCKESFDYFCRRYIYLELAGGDELFSPYKKQSELIDKIEENHDVLVLKSRQVGISTTIQAYAAYMLNFFENTTIGIISKDGRESTDFARSIRGMIEKLPLWMKPKNGKMGDSFDKKAEQSFILSNGSKLFTATVNPQAPNKTLRGKALNFLIIDECAFINKLDEAFESLVSAMATARKQAMKTNSKYGCVILSTPNKTTGPGAWFFSKYTRAMSGEGMFKPFIIHWKDIPELANDPHWFQNQCKFFDGDQRKIEQELELKFLPSSGSFFDEQTCLKVQESCVEPIEKFKLFNGEIWTFEKPIPGKHYIIGVDTATEFGGDKSAITVWDYENLNQVWEYQGKCKVIEFIKVVKYCTAQYNGTIVIENNSVGNHVMEEISNSEFSIMMYKEKRGENKLVPGLSNNMKTRPLMIDSLYSYITQFPEIVRSKRLAMELIGLISKSNGRVEADTGTNDDIAISTALCFYVRKYDPPLFIDSNSYAQNMFTNILDLNDDSFGNEKPIDNSAIMKHVKETVFKYEDSLVNTLKFYRS